MIGNVNCNGVGRICSHTRCGKEITSLFPFKIKEVMEAVFDCTQNSTVSNKLLNIIRFTQIEQHK